MYVYNRYLGVQSPDNDIVHILMENPERENDKLTACGFIVWPDYRYSPRNPDCKDCNDVLVLSLSEYPVESRE
jgi:hypothetical protein